MCSIDFAKRSLNCLRYDLQMTNTLFKFVEEICEGKRIFLPLSFLPFLGGLGLEMQVFLFDGGDNDGHPLLTTSTSLNNVAYGESRCA